MIITENQNLKEMTTFKIGGNARFFCHVKNEEDIIEAFTFIEKKKIPFFILGGGSNILISDKGFSGLVIKVDIKGIEYIEDEDGNTRVTVMAGENWDNFVGETVKRGLHGLENLSLIPGTVGASPVQNIGAYGSEVKDTIDIVRAFDTKDGEFVDLSNFDCHFAYRDSIFKRESGRHIIVSVTFILKKNGKINVGYKDLTEYFHSKNIHMPTLAEVREAVIHIRTNKLPDPNKIGTVGSFFKNAIIDHSQARDLKVRYPDLPIYPADDEHVKISLAWILDHVCGYKGMTKGNVGTYKNQALVLVNNGNATADEVKSLAREMAECVKEKTGIVIEPEAQYIGEQ